MSESINANVIIKGKNDISAPLRDAKKDLQGFDSVAQQLGSTLKKAFTVTAIVAGISTLTKALAESCKQVAETERKYTQLRLALNDTRGFISVSNKLDELSRKTGESKEVLESLASELAGMGANSESINDLLEASVALSNVTGKDLNTAYRTLANTFNGQTTALKKMGVNVDDLTDKELAAGGAIDKVIEQYKGLSDAVANDSVYQTIENIGTSLQNIKDSFSSAFLDSITPALETIYGWLQKIEEWVNTWSDTSKINNAAKRGESLEGYSLGQINAAISTVKNNTYWTDKKLAEFEDNYYHWANWKPRGDRETQLYNLYVARDAATVPTSSSGVPDAAPRVWGFASTGEDDDSGKEIVKTLSDFLSSQTSNSLSLQIASYQKIIDEATKWLAEDNGENTQALNEIISTYTGKIKDITAEPPIEPTELEKILASYGKNSKAYQVKLLEDEIGKVTTALKTTSGDDAIYLTEIQKSLNEQLEELTKIDGNIKKTFLDKLQEVLSNKITSLFNVSLDQGKVAGAKVLDYVVSSLGEVGNVAKELATNMTTMGSLLGAIVTALKYVFEGIGQVLTPIFNEITTAILLPLREIGRMLGSMIAPILELLTPALKVLAKSVVTITGTVQYVIQLLQHIISSFINWIASLSILGWRPLSGIAIRDPGSPGGLTDYISNKWNEVDSIFTSGVGTSSNPAVTNASYSGGTSINMNIYVEAPVVGDNGMLTFAQMIREQLLELDYVGR